MALRLALVLALLLLGSYSGVQCQQATTETGPQGPPSGRPVDLQTLTEELTVALELLQTTSLQLLQEQVRYRATVERNMQDLRDSLEDVTSKQLELKQDIRDILNGKTNNSTKGAPYLDCRDAYEKGGRHSGVYTIQPDRGHPFEVYCDMETDGGGWTVFQRRQDGSQDFYLFWDDYERGFGNLTCEFWLGLSKIHRITASATHTGLRVDLSDFSSNRVYAKYTDFTVGNTASNYTMTVSGYSGTAADSLSQDSGQQFTTADRDNDIFVQNCAQGRRGAWWYRACTFANLNGYYFPSTGQTVSWWHWKLTWERLKFTEMKLRRA